MQQGDGVRRLVRRVGWRQLRRHVLQCLTEHVSRRDGRGGEAASHEAISEGRDKVFPLDVRFGAEFVQDRFGRRRSQPVLDRLQKKTLNVYIYIYLYIFVVIIYIYIYIYIYLYIFVVIIYIFKKSKWQ